MPTDDVIRDKLQKSERLTPAEVDYLAVWAMAERRPKWHNLVGWIRRLLGR